MPAFKLPVTDTLKIIAGPLGNSAVIFRGDGSAKSNITICIAGPYNKCDTISVLANTDV